MIIRTDSRRVRMARRRPLWFRLARFIRLECAAWRAWHATVSGRYPREIPAARKRFASFKSPEVGE